MCPLCAVVLYKKEWELKHFIRMSTKERGGVPILLSVALDFSLNYIEGFINAVDSSGGVMLMHPEEHPAVYSGVIDGISVRKSLWPNLRDIGVLNLLHGQHSNERYLTDKNLTMHG